MSVLEWTAVLVSAGIILIVLHLSRIGTRLNQITLSLQSLDAEVFRLAQEQISNYGICTNCGRRATVRHVIPKDSGTELVPDMFFCQSCWWMSDSVRVSDENKQYKDRMTARDKIAADIGPG